MHIIFLLGPIILVFQSGMADNNTIPVFMIDESQIMTRIPFEPNPFDKMGSSEFADIIHQASKNSDGVLIFIEETFSVDDISLKYKGGSPYNYLRQNVMEKKAKYFPAVIEPYKLLTSILQPHKSNVFYLKAHTKLKLTESFKYLYIYFQDGLNETRSELLMRHDIIIREVCVAVQQLKSGPVIAFYTGKTNPARVAKLNSLRSGPMKVTPKNIDVMVASYGALFRFSDMYLATPGRSASFDKMPVVADEKLSNHGMSTKMAYDQFEIEFNFRFLKDRWLLENVAILDGGEEVGRTRMDVGAPWNMSYRCGDPLVIVNNRDGGEVVIPEYQIQPRHRHDSVVGERIVNINTRREDEDPPEDQPPAHDPPPTPTTFDQSVTCSNYFNPVIVTNLMISFLFGSILMYGMVCLMSIKSNDRFEDPQSKQMIHHE